jgi:hypothetical protein
MRTLSTEVHPGNVVPPDPAEVGIAAVGWERRGLLRRLLKVEREALGLAAEDRTPAAEPARRAA